LLLGLSKAPRDYPNAKNMPHVMVALDMVKNGRPVNVGDHIPYVICMGEFLFLILDITFIYVRRH
jgi:DNA polymerase alpha subunit A